MRWRSEALRFGTPSASDKTWSLHCSVWLSQLVDTRRLVPLGFVAIGTAPTRPYLLAVIGASAGATFFSFVTGDGRREPTGPVNSSVLPSS